MSSNLSAARTSALFPINEDSHNQSGSKLVETKEAQQMKEMWGLRGSTHDTALPWPCRAAAKPKRNPNKKTYPHTSALPKLPCPCRTGRRRRRDHTRPLSLLLLPKTGRASRPSRA